MGFFLYAEMIYYKKEYFIGIIIVIERINGG